MNEKILRETAYGTTWENDGQTFVKFTGSDRIYEITEDECKDAIDYTIDQMIGSHGPAKQLRNYLENREG